MEGYYDYRCPECRGNDIAFVRFQIFKKGEGRVLFYCRVCKKTFSVMDMEGIKVYIPDKIYSLRKRYPLKERDQDGLCCG
jgi:uncharacterized protein YbaR (Trm112 family)